MAPPTSVVLSITTSGDDREVPGVVGSCWLGWGWGWGCFPEDLLLPIPRAPQPTGATGEGSTGMEVATIGMVGKVEVEEEEGRGWGGPKGGGREV